MNGNEGENMYLLQNQPLRRPRIQWRDLVWDDVQNTVEKVWTETLKEYTVGGRED
jgi:hypothetical protein